jgi:sugar/nucleoside kinase (ribokinase family)
LIVTLGDLTLDILVKPDRHAPGRPPNSPGSVTMTSGGHAANFAVWISRLGGNARFIGKVGKDPAAELLVWDLLKEGVLPETVASDGSTATLTHIAKPAGAPDLVPDRGVAVQLKPEEVQDAWLEDAEWLHLPAPALWAQPIGTAAAKAVRLARQAGARLSVDLESAAGLRAYGVAKLSVLVKTLRPDVIFATQDQAALFTAGALGEMAKVAVLKLGLDGCAAADDSGYREYPPEQRRSLDPSGAEDAFDAAWCLAYLQTGSSEQACVRANRLRARVAAQHGTRPEVDLKGIA